jgi:hypothetical protein
LATDVVPVSAEAEDAVTRDPHRITHDGSRRHMLIPTVEWGTIGELRRFYVAAM